MCSLIVFMSSSLLMVVFRRYQSALFGVSYSGLARSSEDCFWLYVPMLKCWTVLLERWRFIISSFILEIDFVVHGVVWILTDESQSYWIWYLMCMWFHLNSVSNLDFKYLCVMCFLHADELKWMKIVTFLDWSSVAVLPLREKRRGWYIWSFILRQCGLRRWGCK